MDRLQPVTHVRQRPSDDDGHRVVEVRLAKLGLDVDLRPVSVAGGWRLSGVGGLGGKGFVGHSRVAFGTFAAHG